MMEEDNATVSLVLTAKKRILSKRNHLFRIPRVYMPGCLLYTATFTYCGPASPEPIDSLA